MATEETKEQMTVALQTEKKGGGQASTLKRSQTTSNYNTILDELDLSEASEKVKVPSDLEDILDSVDEEVQFFIDKPYHESNETQIDKYFIADIVLMSILAIIGIIITAIKVNKADDVNAMALDVSGSLLFTAGFTPLVLTAYSLFSGATKYFKQNCIKAGSSAILTAIGAILLAYSGELDVALLFGTSSMEIGVLFFMTHMFSLGEDSERIIEKLEGQLEEARKAVGAGLALSYFYNFIKPVCNDLYRDKDTGKVHEKGDHLIMLVKEAYNKDPVEHVLARRVMTILIPRDLNENNLRGEVRKLGYQGHVKNFSTFRGMFQPVLKTWKSQKDARLYCSGMCDVPTVISSIYDRKLDVEKRRKEAKDEEERYHILPVDVPNEIMGFQNNLIQLIAQYPETKGRVRIVSIPPAPIDDKACWDAIAVIDADKVTLTDQEGE